MLCRAHPFLVLLLERQDDYSSTLLRYDCCILFPVLHKFLWKVLSSDRFLDFFERPFFLLVWSYAGLPSFVGWGGDVSFCWVEVNAFGV